MPELAAFLRVVGVRWQARQALLFLAVSGVVFALGLIVTSMSVAALVAGVAFVTLFFTQRQVSLVQLARAVEASAGSLDNLIVTAAELQERPRPVRAEIEEAIATQAAERLRSVNPRQVVPLVQPIGVLLLVSIGCVLLAGLDRGALSRLAPPLLGSLATPATSFDFTVRITPPPYTGRRAEVINSPVQVTVIAGSRVEIDAPGNRRTLTATESAGLEIRGLTAEPRFLSLIVVPDAAPSLRILDPGKDTAFAEPKGQLAINIDGRDDLGLSSVTLKFTKAAGGGENLAFTEGEVPLRIDRRNAQHWQAQAALSLEALGLEDGDLLVYRAIARDTNPAGEPVMSEQYLIEIGKNSQIADAGFSLPTEEKKYAISQQMVIYKTEQLLKSRGKVIGEAWLEQSRLIAMEQRMVRAEVVFLGGGEVEDEVEEAARSDELTEGRLQNTGRAEMLNAINAMSRAEAQLNDGRVPEALVFEREALASLERALDRRRYFLRTLPDRSRIDVTRRLTGERRDARSWTRDPAAAAPSTTLEGQRQIMRTLATGKAGGAEFAARIAAIDPASTELQQAAVAIASASTDAARLDAALTAMRAVTAHALRTLQPSMPATIRTDALSGKLADELSRTARPPK